jgi:hypothetical protein
MVQQINPKQQYYLSPFISVQSVKITRLFLVYFDDD